MKKLALLVLLWCHSLFAQHIAPNVRFLETQKTIVDPYALTLSLSSKGELNFLGFQTPVNFSIMPNIQLGYKSDFFEYSQPVRLDYFNFYPVQEDLGSIEVKKRRYEFGLGVTASAQESAITGLIPYAGAMQMVVKVRGPKVNEKIDMAMPKKLKDLDHWKVGDAGTYQTIGGIQAYATFGAATLKLLNFSFGLQNQFIVQMKKISDDEIVLGITEENLKKRRIAVGPYFAEWSVDRFKGSRFTVQFTLNRNVESHHELFEKAIDDGDLMGLQEELPTTSQQMSWEGMDRNFFVGIPMVAGFQKTKSHYGMESEGVETIMDVRTSSNEGLIRPKKVNKKAVYHNDQSMVILWDSMMGKHTGKDLDDHFVSKGRIIGAKGFAASIPTETSLKNVITQFGISFDHYEISLMTTVVNDDLIERLKARCLELVLSCKDPKRLQKISDKLQEIFDIDEPKDMRKELGFLFLEEPAVIHAFIKTLDLKKSAYFKFLNDRYQSIEGMAEIQ